MVVKSQDQVSLDWITLLSDELDKRIKVYERCDDYYSGRQGERFVASGYRELFTQAFAHYRENICEVVVDTVEQRLDVDGFRFPSVAREDATATDPIAWQVWQDNDMDARSQIAHSESLIKGVSYVLVSPFDNQRVGPGGRSPLITIEQPSEAIVATSPGGRKRIVGMKRWRDDIAKRTFVTLFYPDRIEKFQGAIREWANQHGTGLKEIGGFERRIVEGEDWPLPHRLGAVPLVPLVNRPRLGSGLFAGIDGRSDIAQIIPVQDAINFIALNAIVASDKAAFPQKWATGVEIPIDPKTGKPKDWAPDIASILSTAVPDAKFGNFDVVEMSQYDAILDGKLKLVAAMTQIPLGNFVQQSGQPQSGDAREASEIGLTKKVERRQTWFGEAWEEIQRLAARQLGDKDRADDTACEAVWQPAATEPAASKIDALTKERQTLKVPLEVLWERAGYSASQRSNFRKLLEAEREWLSSTPVQTTQPTAVPGPDDEPIAPPSSEPPAAPAEPAP